MSCILSEIEVQNNTPTINNSNNLVPHSSCGTQKINNSEIKKPPTIHASIQYNHFKPHPLQRKISQKNLNELRKSIEDHDLTSQYPLKVIQPIGEVSESNPYLVWDGNHRYKIIVERQTPVYFSICEDFQERDIINTGYSLSKWNIEHFCDYYCKLGYEEYQKFKKFHTDFRLDKKTALPLTKEPKNRTYLSDIFRNGDFIFENEREIRFKVELTVKFLEKLISFKMASNAFLRNSHFFDGFIKLMQHKSFNFEKLINNVEKHGTKELDTKIPNFTKFIQYYNFFKYNFLGVKPENEI